MKIYEEKDVIRLMQFLISNEELENTSGISESTAKHYLKEFNSLKKDYVPEKQWYAVFGIQINIDFEELESFDIEKFREGIKETGLISLDLEKHTMETTEVKVPIAQETADFLKEHCNIERNSPFEDTYVLNNLRFGIVEE